MYQKRRCQTGQSLLVKRAHNKNKETNSEKIYFFACKKEGIIPTNLFWDNAPEQKETTLIEF